MYHKHILSTMWKSLIFGIYQKPPDENPPGGTRERFGTFTAAGVSIFGFSLFTVGVLGLGSSTCTGFGGAFFGDAGAPVLTPKTSVWPPPGGRRTLLELRSPWMPEKIFVDVIFLEKKALNCIWNHTLYLPGGHSTASLCWGLQLAAFPVLAGYDRLKTKHWMCESNKNGTPEIKQKVE